MSAWSGKGVSAWSGGVGGGVCSRGGGGGGVCSRGGLPGPGGWCLLLGGLPGLGGSAWSGGVSAWSGGSAWSGEGVVSAPWGGLPGLGGVLPSGDPPVNRMTNRCTTITLSHKNVAAGKKPKI